MHKSISFFWSKKRYRHLSTKIRARELHKFIKNSKLSPESGYDDDVCVFLKPSNPDMVKDGWWVDVLDGGKFVKKLRNRPNVNLIACSQNSYDYLKETLPDNKLVLIPHQHINWERHTRDRSGVTRCGYVGSPSDDAKRIYADMKKEVEARCGVEFVNQFRMKSRSESVNFYRSIDILVIGAWELGDPNLHKIPTKIINAASYGVPAIAYPLAGYKEIEGYYTRIRNMEDVVSEIEKFKDPKYYDKKTKGLIEMAEKYHIDNIAKMYKKLL